MEGPSLIILREEAQKFVGKRVTTCSGSASVLDCGPIEGKTLRGFSSWGKHFLISFDRVVLRIHFLMFGSYTIDREKPDKIPRLSLTFRNGSIHFYTCSVQVLSGPPEEIYDWRVDIMSSAWNEQHVRRLMSRRLDEMTCDVLLQQDLFAGSGNIIKNEVLHNCRLHPETRLRTLTARRRAALVREVRAYGRQFYEWKKVYVLRKNWRVYRRKLCATCGSQVVMKKTGELNRVSFFCPRCQPPEK